MQETLAAIITLTTDFGTRDGYVGQMKGAILSVHPNAAIVDVTHDIEPYTILPAALVLKQIFRTFPEGTVHVGVVDPGVGGPRRGIAGKADGSCFVGPDNGLFSLILSAAENVQIRSISVTPPEHAAPHPTFHGRDVFAPIAAGLASGRSFEQIGPLIDDPERIDLPRPKVTSAGITGEIIFADRFGNLTTNIRSDLIFNQSLRVIAGGREIPGLLSYFEQVEPGRALALLNSFDLLEIAVNRGNALQDLGLGPGDRVEVLWLA